jgi:hypothetical protein
MKEQLINFIKNNSLNFNTTGSGLNSACVIICGYALHLGATVHEITKAIEYLFPESDFLGELGRVFDYAEHNKYGSWWSNPEAKKMYKF